MDIVWLKRDGRIHDHAPLSTAIKQWRIGMQKNKVIILYCYEPDQLAEYSVYGSHVEFCSEGLVDLDQKLASGLDVKVGSVSDVCDYEFQVLTVCYAGVVFTLQQILSQIDCGIRRVLTHMETGHLRSYARDKGVRRWCRNNGVQII